MLIDTHAHINFNSYRDDWREVIQRALTNQTFLINVGSQIDTSRRAVKIAGDYQRGVWAAVGLHPIHLQDIAVDEEESSFKTRAEEFNYDQYRGLARNDKVVAIGEIGLDYFRLPKNNTEQIIAKQKEVFIRQLDLAQELDLPVIIHCRSNSATNKDAHADLLRILAQYQNLRGVAHCFTGTLDEARQYWEVGFLTSFTGIVTFSDQFDEILKTAPEDKFMVETDCPYLAPLPYRGKRNEPLYVRYIAEKIANIRGFSLDEIAQLTTQNARKLFNLDLTKSK